MACPSPVPTCCRAPLGTRPRDGTGTLVPHHPHSTSCPGSRCVGMGMGFLDVSPCMADSPPPSSGFIVTTICGATDAPGVWQMELFALPLLMTGEKAPGHPSRTRCRAVDPAGGEWGHGLGVGGRRGEGDCRPTRRSPRQWRRRTTGRHHVHANVDTTRTSSQSHRPTPSPWDNGWYIGLRPARLVAACGEMAARADVSTVVFSEWGYVGKRAFDKAFLSNDSLRRLPFAASVGHQGQRCRALLM